MSGCVCFLVMIIINFLLPRMMPGDPVLMLTGQEDEAVSLAQYEIYREKLGLDDPLAVQFISFFKDVVSGDLGFSYHYNDTVSNLLKTRIPNTLQIAIPAVVLSSCLAVLLGCNAGFHKNGRADNILSSSLIILHAIPSFLLAMIIVMVLAFHARLFPLGSLNSIIIPQGWLPAILDRAKHLVLPVLTVTLSGLPAKYLMVRNTVAAAAGEKYVIYARVRGIGEKQIKYIHILKNVCSPFITIVGLNIGFMIAGSMVTEIIFSINGMGGLIYDASTFRDFPTLQGCLLAVSAMVIIANILTDFICKLIDPRQRYGVFEYE